jgi:hypothetical protein
MSPLQAADIADFVDFVATEMSHAASAAVDRWIAEIDAALTDPHLTTLGRLNAVHQIVERYKLVTGRTEFDSKLMPARLAS